MAINRKKFLPVGAISLDKIDKIYLDRVLEEDGEEDLAKVLSTFAYGMILEEEGKYLEARNLYKESLKIHPENPWIEEALERVHYSIN